MTILCQAEDRSLDEAAEKMAVDSHTPPHLVFLKFQ